MRFDEERLERSVTLLAQCVIDAGGGSSGDLPPEVNAAIDWVLDELDSLDCTVTSEFGSSADETTAVQKGLAGWKRWRKERDGTDG